VYSANNLHCYVTFGRSGLPVTTLAYSVHPLVKNTMKCCEFDSSDCIHFKMIY